MPSIQGNNEIEDDDMDQDTSVPDTSDDDKSDSLSGIENEDSSCKSSYYRLQREWNLKRRKET